MIQGVRENPEGAGGRRHLGPLLDNLRWDPYEACNLQKKHTFREQFLLLHHLSDWKAPGDRSEHRTLRIEEITLAVMRAELKSCLRTASAFALRAACFLHTKLHQKKSGVALTFLTHKPEVALGGEKTLIK